MQTITSRAWCGRTSHRQNCFGSLYSRSLPSRLLFSFESARRCGYSNLLIQRSAMSLIGTGLMKCSLSLPSRLHDTKFACLRIARCFATAWRVISSPRQSSPSVCPFLRCSLSRSLRRLASASARKTVSSVISQYGTIWFPVTIGNFMVACQAIFSTKSRGL